MLLDAVPTNSPTSYLFLLQAKSDRRLHGYYAYVNARALDFVYLFTQVL